MTERILRLWPHGTAAREVRAVVADICEKHDLRELRDTAALLASELAADALTRVRGLLTIAIETNGPKLAVAVLEEEPSEGPVETFERDLRLTLLDSLATRWGFRETRGGGALWFQLDRATGDRDQKRAA